MPSKRRPISATARAQRSLRLRRPSSFSRGLRLDLGGVAVLLISGTASIDTNGETVHVGDFRAQSRRTFDNITGLLEAEGATWQDIVRTTCYLRDIERDYAAFNDERTTFYQEQELDPLPASTGIQAILCRPDLLVEIEAIAMFRRTRRKWSNRCISQSGLLLACWRPLAIVAAAASGHTVLVRRQSARPPAATA